ncbi:MAG TPA: hypothetical protein PLB97_02700 [Accumulibacter sp.]|nr:hypothetical protein [Accumulibacter sp.]HPP48262.1 hypothetical protein [Accumulibacter sp.]
MVKPPTATTSVAERHHDMALFGGILIVQPRRRFEHGTHLDQYACSDQALRLVWRGQDVQEWSGFVAHAPLLYIRAKVIPKR